LFNEASKAECPHYGSVSFKAQFRRVLIKGKPLVTVSDRFQIRGCKRNHPCIFVNWLSISSKVLLNGHEAVRKGGGFCVGGSPGMVPQGKISVQDKVIGV
jgi:hypothetical protein